MALRTTTEILPLSTDDDGVIRVGGTRVTLDTIIAAFIEGATAEEIAQQYPSVRLAENYSVNGYKLRRHDDNESYLKRRRKQADEARQQNEARLNPEGIRERLLARQANGSA